MRGVLLLALLGCDGGDDRSAYEIANSDRAQCIFGEWPIGGGHESTDCANVCTPKPPEAPRPGVTCPSGLAGQDRIVVVAGVVGVCIQEVRPGDIPVNWMWCTCGQAVPCEE